MVSALNIRDDITSMVEKRGVLFCISAFFMSMVIGGCFFLETSPHRIMLYIALLSGVVSISRAREWPFLLAMNSRVFLISLLFLFWNLLSISWSDIPDVERVIQKVKPAIFISSFLATIVYLLRREAGLYRFFIEFFILCAIISGALILALNADKIYANFFIEYRNWRLEGLGRAENSNQAGLLYGAALLIFPFLKYHYFKFLNVSFLKVICGLVIAASFLLPMSRGAFFAFVSTLILLAFIRLFMDKENRARTFIITGLCIVCAAVFAALYPDAFAFMVERGTTGRSQIWIQALEQLKGHSLLGHGIASKFYYEIDVYNGSQIIGHVHNIYLAALLHLGVVGFVLFMALASCALHKLLCVLRSSNEPAIFTLFLLGLFFGLVDMGGHYNSLTNSWIIFWFPLAVLVAYDKGVNLRAPSNE